MNTNATFMSAIGLTLCLAGINAPQAQEMTDDAEQSSFYVGFGQAQRTVETIFGDIDGDGSSIFFGYRVDDGLSFELETQDIDYDDLTVGDERAFDTTGEFTYFSIIASGKYGSWEPYAKLIFGNSDVSLKVEDADGNVVTSSTSDSGDALGLGVNYAFTDNFLLRADFTIQSEHQDVLTIAPIWRF